MMRNSLKDKFRLFLYHRIPILETVLLMFLFYMPINFLDLHSVRPVVGFICVYYWTLKRRYMFGYVSAFCVGFLMDIYSSTPLGINVLIMMLLVLATDVISKYFKAASFSVNWLVFFLVSIIICFVKWIIFYLYFAIFLPIRDVLFNLFSTLMFYPIVVYINVWVQNNMLPKERINE